MVIPNKNNWILSLNPNSGKQFFFNCLSCRHVHTKYFEILPVSAEYILILLCKYKNVTMNRLDYPEFNNSSRYRRYTLLAKSVKQFRICAVFWHFENVSLCWSCVTERARRLSERMSLRDRDARFGSKVGPIGTKWGKSGTFSDQISVHLVR